MWKQKLKLEEGETLRLDRARERGHLGQEEVESYSVIDRKGEVVGSVEHTNHTAVNGFRRTESVVQRKAGVTLVDERWGD